MFENCSRYYYTILNAEDKIAYKSILSEFENKKKEFKLEYVNIKNLIKIIEMILLDNPNLFYVDIGKIVCIISRNIITIRVQYLFTDDEIALGLKLVEKHVRNFHRKHLNSKMNDYEKELKIHDYLSNTITYNENSLPGSVFKNDHNIIGGLIEGKCVCEGIAKSIKFLCDSAGIKSIVVFGDAKNINADTESKSGHAWNIIKLEKECYHLDMTWDITMKLRNASRYDYFNLSDMDIGIDHSWNKLQLPKCKGLTYNYFYQNKFYVKSKNELAEFIRTQLKNGNTNVILKLLCEIPTVGELSSVINKILTRQSYFGLKQTSISYSIGFNMNQRIVYIDFK